MLGHSNIMRGAFQQRGAQQPPAEIRLFGSLELTRHYNEATPGGDFVQATLHKKISLTATRPIFWKSGQARRAELATGTRVR